MIFCTYPSNQKKITALIPILASELLNSLRENKGIYLIDGLQGKESDRTFYLTDFLQEKSLEYTFLKQNTIDSYLLKVWDHLVVTEDEWIVCDCGKVEVINYIQLKKFDLVDNNSCCLLCRQKVTLRKLRGLTYFFDANSLLKDIFTDVAKRNMFPYNHNKQLAEMLSVLNGQKILLSRQRQTGVFLQHNGQLWNLDPSIFNVIASWDHFSRNTPRGEEPCIITGPTSLYSYALGLIFSQEIVKHIFLPRFKVSEKEKILKTDIQALELLIFASISWKKNASIVNWNDLGYIMKNKGLILEKMKGMDMSQIGDISNFNKNILDLKWKY